MHEVEVRSSFEKIVWVSVGQEPDIRELQGSIYYQLAAEELSSSLIEGTKPME